MMLSVRMCIALCAAACCLLLSVNAAEVELSPAEMAFSFAELSSTQQAEGGVRVMDSFTSESADANENESDASDEGLAMEDIFIEASAMQSPTLVPAIIDPKVEPLPAESVPRTNAAAPCPKKAEPVIVSPCAKKNVTVTPADPNPIVAVVDGRSLTKSDYESAKHSVTVPKLMDPQPINGVKVSGKATPGFHCEHRVDCESCLRLSSCLWNSKARVCSSTSEVRTMFPQQQWRYIATCDRSVPTSQRRVDNRRRRSVRAAVVRNRGKASRSALVELQTQIKHIVAVDADEQSEEEMRAEDEQAALIQQHQEVEEAAEQEFEQTHATPVELANEMKVFLDESPSLPIEAAASQEEQQFVQVPQKALTETDSEIAVEAESESESESESEGSAALMTANGSDLAEFFAVTEANILARRASRDAQARASTMAKARALVTAHAHIEKLRKIAKGSKPQYSTGGDFTRTTSGLAQDGKGVDMWLLPTDREVENGFLGLPIGSLPADSNVVVELYKYVNGLQHEGEQVQVLYGYGYVAGSKLQYGGWSGMNSCGWFPLERASQSLTLRAHLTKSIARHPRLCPPPSTTGLTDGLLSAAVHLDESSYLLPTVQAATPKLTAAIVNETCFIYLNYDPLVQRGIGSVGVIAKGVASGNGVIGAIPAGPTSVSKNVNSFGVRYVTRDGNMALVNYPGFLPQRGNGNKFYFVPAKCISYDKEAVAFIKQNQKL